MKINDLVRLRIENQRLNKTKLGDPEEVVNWFCAMQAQDYLGALWSVGQRLAKSNEAAVEKAIADRKIVRTWPMRGTLHFVSPGDVRWMLKLLTPRVIAKSKTLYKQQGLESKIFAKSRRIIERALAQHGQLTRTEIYDALMKEKVAVNEQRGIHIIGNAAQEQVICFGPRAGKQPTFVLLDEWIPKSRNLTRDESLAELASRYLDSHGPATMADFSWWSGLTLAEVKRSFEIIQNKLTAGRVNDTDYYMKPFDSIPKPKAMPASLLSWFDEYIIGYRDRSAAFDPATEKFIVKPKNGIYTPVLLIDGKITGNWKRAFEKKKVKVEIAPFRKLNESEKKQIDQALRRYRLFLET